MGSKKQKTKTKPEPTQSRMAIAIQRVPVALTFVWPALLVIAIYVGSTIYPPLQPPLKPEHISITAPSRFVPDGIVNTVYRDTGLEQVSLLDVNAASRIANAFATSPWIETVQRIQKSNGKVEVDVTYREPVAMVEVVSRHPEVNGTAFLPVDRNGILLPTEDFTPGDTQQFVHIRVPDTYPASGKGMPYGDQRVEHAAMLAGLLIKYRDKISLNAITVEKPISHIEQPPILVLVMQDGRQISWGNAPGHEQSGEANAVDKLKRLLQDPSTSSLRLHVASERSQFQERQ